MKDFTRNVAMLCPICGNDQFESLDADIDDLGTAADDVRIKCSDCGAVFTKEELIKENSERINANVDEVKEEMLKQFDKELKKTLRKFK